MESFYWYDYETFGADPARDRPAQFAGQRTDLELNPVGEPMVLYCRPAPDFLPAPDACLLTGITPQLATARGIPETDFIEAINAEFSVAQTCVAGYNNIRFDDEVTRYTLYRNLMDPYAREWRLGNSRWDLIDVLRMTYALRPEGITWPVDEQGMPSFRLDRLTQANGIVHADAHDALSDVQGTISLARLLKCQQPRLFAFMLAHRSKAKAAQLLGLGKMQPVIHASSRFSAERGCVALVVALAQHPRNPNNGVVTWDLAANPDPLLDLSAEELHERLYTPRAELPEGVERIALKTVHLNKCPALAPMKALREKDAQRLRLDVPLCLRHLDQLKTAAADLPRKVSSILSISAREEAPRDQDLMLYGGFIANQDRQKLDEFRSLSPEHMPHAAPRLTDSRLDELLFRYRARNYPETLNEAERTRWRAFCHNRLTDPKFGASLTQLEFEQRIAGLEQTCRDDSQMQILDALREYANRILADACQA